MLENLLEDKGFKRYSIGDRIYNEFTVVVYTVDDMEGIVVHVPKNIPDYFYKVNRILEHGYRHLLPKPLRDAMAAAVIPFNKNVTLWYLQEITMIPALKRELAQVTTVLGRRSPDLSKTICYLELIVPNDPTFYRIIRMTSKRYLSSVMFTFKKQARNALYNKRTLNKPYVEWVKRNIDDIEAGNISVKYIVKDETPSNADKQLKKYLSKRKGHMLNYYSIKNKKAVLT